MPHAIQVSTVLAATKIRSSTVSAAFTRNDSTGLIVPNSRAVSPAVSMPASRIGSVADPSQVKRVERAPGPRFGLSIQRP